MWVALQSAGAIHSEDVEFEIDSDALLAIYQGVPEDVLASLADKDTTKAASDVFATRLNKLVSSIPALRDDDIEEHTVVQKILQTAPARLMHIVSALDQMPPSLDV